MPSSTTLTDILLFTTTCLLTTALSSVHPSRKDKALNRSTTSTSATMLSANECVCTTLVDDVTGVPYNIPTPHGHLRHIVRLHKLWHRATYVVVRMKADNTILVQRRSKLKDYAPGMLDPTPGGVVGYNESYAENVARELEEEMGLIEGTNCENLRRLFTFQYSDDFVKCWGDLWEVTFTGNDASNSIQDLPLQEEEVDEVLCLSLEEVKRMAIETPEEWMPDGWHAIQLYLQYQHDAKVRRRHFISSSVGKSSSGDLDSYSLRPKVEAIFFDCDDCLYFDDWKVATMLTAKIESWFNERGHPEGYAYELYKRFGTALKGLQAEKLIDDSEEAIDDYLREVHDIPINAHIKRDKRLREVLEKMDSSIPKYIFTASVRHHAERCLDALGISDMFEDIIDVKACNLATKHTEEAFNNAMRIAGVSNPSSCLFFDDSTKNIAMGARMGWRCVLVGRVGRDCGSTIHSNGAAEHEVDRIHELPNIMPELFVQ